MVAVCGLVCQMCITASQMQWTADVTKALSLSKERGDKKALKSLKKKQVTTNQSVNHSVSQLFCRCTSSTVNRRRYSF